MDSEQTLTAWLPDLLYDGKRWLRDTALVCEANGRILELVPAAELDGRVIRLSNQALLPGLINAHSHAFQRVIRGRTEHRSSAAKDSFWTWRSMMYSAATRLTPEDIYDASRMAFMEMALSGITTVGEFHYLHHSTEGAPYTEPNLLASTVVGAALDVGIRIALLRVGYFRAGFEQPVNPLQARFIEPSIESYLTNVENLRQELANRADDRAWIGVAPHSVRAVPLAELRTIAAYADTHQVPLHIHVAEQPAEIEACFREYGASPIELFSEHGILSGRFTGVHAIHITQNEIAHLSAAGANICACPTTERNLGDGIIPADLLLAAGVPLSLGSDSQAQIDLFEEARELEYHLRLQKLERNVLAPDDSRPAALAERLFGCATSAGARSLGSSGGQLTSGQPADFFTVDLLDPSIAGADLDNPMGAIVFAAGRSAVRQVFVAGIAIVADGEHPERAAIVQRFCALQTRLWS